MNLFLYLNDPTNRLLVYWINPPRELVILLLVWNIAKQQLRIISLKTTQQLYYATITLFIIKKCITFNRSNSKSNNYNLSGISDIFHRHDDNMSRYDISILNRYCGTAIIKVLPHLIWIMFAVNLQMSTCAKIGVMFNGMFDFGRVV